MPTEETTAALRPEQPPRAGSPQPPPPGDDPGLIAVEDAATAPKGADGKPQVSDETEMTALDYLLRPPKRYQYEVPVSVETDDGAKDFIFVLRSLPGRMLRDIEKRSSKDGTLGPLAELDDQRVAAETVGQSLVLIKDPASAATLDPRSAEFMVNAKGERLINPGDALSARFEFQSGILMNLASEVRRVSGYSSDRVGTAQRVMVDAVGSSSNGDG